MQPSVLDAENNRKKSHLPERIGGIFSAAEVRLPHAGAARNSDLSLGLCSGSCKGGHAEGQYNEGCGYEDNWLFHSDSPSSAGIVHLPS